MDTIKNIAEYAKVSYAKHTENVSLHVHKSQLKNFYDFEIAYVIAGEAVHITENTEYKISSGNYIFVDYGMKHGYKIESGTELELINITFDYRSIDLSLSNDRSLTKFAKRYFLADNLENEYVREDLVFYDDGKVLDMVKLIKDEMENRKPGYHGFVKCKLLEILLTGLRSYFNTSVEKTYSMPIQYIIDCLSSCYMDDIKLSSFAKELSISLPHLSKKFKEEVGKGFVEYLHERRIIESCRIIASGNDSIENIAAYVGYSDSKKFRERFKSQMGVTPSEYKRNFAGKKHHTA